MEVLYDGAGIYICFFLNCSNIAGLSQQHKHMKLYVVSCMKLLSFLSSSLLSVIHCHARNQQFLKNFKPQSWLATFLFVCAVETISPTSLVVTGKVTITSTVVL